MFSIYLKGLTLGASLIIAIGLQNAFILRQGLKKRFVFASALTASLCDVALIGAGVLGFGTLVEALPGLLTLIRYAGAAFLIVYGAKSFLAARKPQHLETESATTLGTPDSLKKTVLILLGVSLLNPHVYLDTVVLIGGLSASEGDIGKYWFGAGAMTGSFLWFFALAYGSGFLSPLFEKPKAWQILDLVIGCVMWGIAAGLLLNR